MGKEQNIILPKLGESIFSATVVQWIKQEGDRVQLDEPLLEVSTDKVNSEIPSPFAGVLKKICAYDGQELQVGEILAVIEIEEKEEEKEAEEKLSQEKTFTEKSSSLAKEEFLSPAVLRFAKERGISLEDIKNMQGSGENGRITKKDLQTYLQQKESKVIEKKEGEERLPMTLMRKAIAENMIKSFYSAPHASLMTDIDVTSLLSLIEKEKKPFLKIHGIKLTITSFIARAIAYSMRSYPFLNASIEKDIIIMKKSVNLGVAVNIREGLMVPVIKNCEKLSLLSIAKEVMRFAEKAKANTLSVDEVKDGTVTMSNFGMTGIQMGIPIIRYPEVAIIAAGAIVKKVVPIENNQIGIRKIITVTLTFDHRVVDGMYGCGFLKEMKTYLEEKISIEK